MITRRALIAGASALACSHVHAAPAPPRDPRVRSIDCHFHILPPEYRRLVGDARADRRMDSWSVEMSYDALAQVQGEQAITSVTTPGLWFNDVAESRAMIRAANDYGAELARDHAAFPMFAAIALPDVEGSLRELERLPDLKAKGVAVFTSYKIGGKVHWLGDPMFEPVMSEINRRKLVVRTHPDAPCCSGFLMHHNIVDANLEYGTDSNRAIVNMIVSGWLQKYPAVRWIWGHGGGTMTSYIERLIRLSRTHANVRAVAPDMLVELRKMYYDTGQIAHPVPLKGLAEIVGFDRILYGSDFPYRTPADHHRAIEETFSDFAAFGQGAKRKIYRDNMLSLLR